MQMIEAILNIRQYFAQYRFGNMSNSSSTDKMKRRNTYRFKLYEFKKIIPANYNQLEIPHPRSGHRIVCNDSNLYVYGGYSPQYVDPHSGLQRKHVFNELWLFNFATRKWMLLPARETIPPELASVAAYFAGDTLMVYGGSGLPFGMESSNRLYVCSLKKRSFYHGMQLVPVVGALPPPMYGQALVYHDGYLYTIGGTTGFEFTCDIHRLNLTTNTWEEVYINIGGRDNAPCGRYRHEIAFDGSKIYILGGGTNVVNYDFEQLPVFDIEKRVWKKKCTRPDPRGLGASGVPEARKCHSCIQYTDEDGEIFVFMVGGSGDEKVYNELWRLRLRDLQWNLISNRPLPFSIYFNAASVTPNGKMCMFGGVNREELLRTNDLHTAWITIPKLTEMCWEALLHYYPNIEQIDEDVLIKEGVPMNFIKRLSNNLC